MKRPTKSRSARTPRSRIGLAGAALLCLHFALAPQPAQATDAGSSSVDAADVPRTSSPVDAASGDGDTARRAETGPDVADAGTSPGRTGRRALPNEPDALDPPTTAEPPSTGSDLGAMLLETLLVLAAVCLLAYVVLRWGVSRLVGARGAGGDAIEVIARQPVGGDSSILVVRVGPKTLILADGEAGMTRLGELDDEEAEELASAAPEETPETSWIPSFFRREGSSS